MNGHLASVDMILSFGYLHSIIRVQLVIQIFFSWSYDDLVRKSLLDGRCSTESGWRNLASRTGIEYPDTTFAEKTADKRAQEVAEQSGSEGTLIVSTTIPAGVVHCFFSIVLFYPN
jgi:hypothetical protein